jgi:hypothetical protein
MAMATQRKTVPPKQSGKVVRSKRTDKEPTEKWVILYPKERGEIPRARIRAAIDAVRAAKNKKQK